MSRKRARLEPSKRQTLPTDKPVGAAPKGAGVQAGSSVISTTVSTINGFLANSDAQRFREYEKALTTDETVAGAIDFTVLSLVASLGEYKHKRPDVQAFVHANLAAMEGNFRQAISELALSSLAFGFGVSEIIWKTEGGHLWIERLANYHPSSIHIAVDVNGHLSEGGQPMMPGAKDPGIYQLSPLKGYGQYIPLPLSKTCLITHRKRHGNYYGESAIKRIYKHWRYKDPGMEMWAIALDRYGTPVVYAVVPHAQTGNEIVDPYAEGGKRLEMLSDNAAAAISNIHTGTGLVLEQPDPNNKVQLGTLTTGNNYGTTFSDFIDHLNKSITRGLLVPPTVFGESASGLNSSTSKTHFEVFKLMVKSLYAQFVEPFTEQVIGRLVRYNFNETDPGEFPFQPYDASTAETLASMLDKLVKVGAVDTSDLEDLNLVRTMVGIPMRAKPVIASFDQVVQDQRREQDGKVKIAKIRADAVTESTEMKLKATPEPVAPTVISRGTNPKQPAEGKQPPAGAR